MHQPVDRGKIGWSGRFWYRSDIGGGVEEIDIPQRGRFTQVVEGVAGHPSVYGSPPQFGTVSGDGIGHEQHGSCDGHAVHGCGFIDARDGAAAHTVEDLAAIHHGHDAALHL